MKKGILISGIIWAVLAAFTAIICFALAAIFFSPEFLAEFMKTYDGTRAAAEEACKLLGTYMIILGIFMIPTLVLSIVLAAVRNSPSKGLGIALGVVGIVFGAELPGILTIVDAAKNRK